MSLAIHGGAGLISKDHFTDKELTEYRKGLREVLDRSKQMWLEGEEAISIVIECVRLLEDNPLFNAGKGSVLNSQGVVEMDASIMGPSSTHENYWGAGVSGLTQVKNPIYVANELRKMNQHSLLSGEGARNFAKNLGVKHLAPDSFITSKRKLQFQNFLKNKEITLDHGSVSSDKPYQEGQTVGAVCLDKKGNLAAATSTGGMTGKMDGRVSDSAIIGQGTWAHAKTLAISATGTGDHFIQICFCHRVHMRMLYEKLSLEQAIQEGLDELASIGGNGGAVAVDLEGNVSLLFNSGGMFRACFESKTGRETLDIF